LRAARVTRELAPRYSVDRALRLFQLSAYSAASGILAVGTAVVVGEFLGLHARAVLGAQVVAGSTIVVVAGYFAEPAINWFFGRFSRFRD